MFKVTFYFRKSKDFIGESPIRFGFSELFPPCVMTWGEGPPEISSWFHLEFTKTFLCLTLCFSGNISNTWKISLIISAKGTVGSWCRGTGPFSLFVPQPEPSCPPETMTLTRALFLHDNPRAARGERPWGWPSSPTHLPWTLAARNPSTWFDMRS